MNLFLNILEHGETMVAFFKRCLKKYYLSSTSASLKADVTRTLVLGR